MLSVITRKQDRVVVGVLAVLFAAEVDGCCCGDGDGGGSCLWLRRRLMSMLPPRRHGHQTEVRGRSCQ